MTRLERIKARMAAAEKRGLFVSPVTHTDLYAFVAVAEAVDENRGQREYERIIDPLVKEEEDDRA